MPARGYALTRRKARRASAQRRATESMGRARRARFRFGASPSAGASGAESGFDVSEARRRGARGRGGRRRRRDSAAADAYDERPRQAALPRAAPGNRDFGSMRPHPRAPMAPRARSTSARRAHRRRTHAIRCSCSMKRRRPGPRRHPHSQGWRLFESGELHSQTFQPLCVTGFHS
jgi:hypothetical protein